MRHAIKLGTVERAAAGMAHLSRGRWPCPEVTMEKDAFHYYQLGVDALQDGSLSMACEWLVKSIELEVHFKTYERLAFVLDQLAAR